MPENRLRVHGNQGESGWAENDYVVAMTNVSRAEASSTIKESAQISCGCYAEEELRSRSHTPGARGMHRPRWNPAEYKNVNLWSGEKAFTKISDD